MVKAKNTIKLSKEELIDLQIKAMREVNRETCPIPATSVHDDKREKRRKTRKQDTDKAIKESTGE